MKLRRLKKLEHTPRTLDHDPARNRSGSVASLDVGTETHRAHRTLHDGLRPDRVSVTCDLDRTTAGRLDPPPRRARDHSPLVTRQI